MNAVIGMSDLLLDTDLTSEQRDYASVVSSSAEALLTIINDILDFSKIEAGKLDLEHEAFNLRECVEAVMDTIGPLAARKGLDLVYEIDDETPHAVVGDVTRVRQILLNLLNNSVKFTESGDVSLDRVCAAGGQRSGAARPHRARYRYRHPRRQDRGAVRVLQPGGRVDHPPLRGHRARARDLSTADRTDGRHGLGTERRPWSRLGVPRPDHRRRRPRSAGPSGRRDAAARRPPAARRRRQRHEPAGRRAPGQRLGDARHRGQLGCQCPRGARARRAVRCGRARPDDAGDGRLRARRRDPCTRGSGPVAAAAAPVVGGTRGSHRPAVRTRRVRRPPGQAAQTRRPVRRARRTGRRSHGGEARCPAAACRCATRPRGTAPAAGSCSPRTTPSTRSSR